MLYSFFVFHSEHFEFVSEIYTAVDLTIDYFFVRNPFDRVKSLYIDKLLLSPEYKGPQYCQQIMLQHFKLGNLNQLAGVDFERFCVNLPFFYKEDGHFFPQEIGFRGNKVRKIIRIEEDFSWLSKELSVDFARKNHRSPEDLKAKLTFSDKGSLAIQSIYAYDFKLFDYPPAFQL